MAYPYIAQMRLNSRPLQIAPECHTRLLGIKPCSHHQQCRSNVRLCRKNRSTHSVRQCCFDDVAGVDGALLMFLFTCGYSTWST